MSAINEDLRCLQVCVQKSASTSVSELLGLTRPELSPGQPIPNHLTAAQLRDLLGAERWSTLRTFAFVRNPWDRLVSWHSMIINNPDHPGPFFRYVRETAPHFRDVLRCTEKIPVTSAGVTSWRCLFTNQTDYLVDADGHTLVGFVGRFEKLREDIARLLPFLGLPPERIHQLPHHRHNSAHRHYTEYYDAELAARVGERFAKDIATFGYRFGD